MNFYLTSITELRSFYACSKGLFAVMAAMPGKPEDEQFNITNMEFEGNAGFFEWYLWKKATQLEPVRLVSVRRFLLAMRRHDAFRNLATTLNSAMWVLQPVTCDVDELVAKMAEQCQTKEDALELLAAVQQHFGEGAKE